MRQRQSSLEVPFVRHIATVTWPHSGVSGIQSYFLRYARWIPAFAGMTHLKLMDTAALLPLLAHQPALLPIPVALLLGLALVVQLLAFGEA